MSILVSPAPSDAYECIASGETKLAKIEFGGEPHSYSFWARAGQGVVIEMADLSSAPGIVAALAGLEPRVQLWDPNSVRIADVGADGHCYARATVVNCQLKMTGVYTIVVSDADGSWWSGWTTYTETLPDAGEYGLSLVVTSGATTSLQDPDGGDMTDGRARRGTISPAGDTDTYVIYVVAGQAISVEATDWPSGPDNNSALAGLELRVQLYEPNGAQVVDQGADGRSYSRTTIENYRAKKTGFYTIVVSDTEGSWWSGWTTYTETTPDTGEYGLAVAVMPPQEPRGLYPCEPQPVEGSSIDYCDPNYRLTDIVVENRKLPDGKVVTRWSGGNLLSWWSVLGATGYDVYLAVGPCQPLEKVAENLAHPYLPMPVLDPNEVYYWQVVAHTPAGDVAGPIWWFAIEPCDSSTLAISAIGRGSIVDPNAGIQSYPQGQVVSVTAQADPDFEFVRWEGSAVDANKVVVEYQNTTGSKISVTVDGAYTLKAVFEETVGDFSLDTDPGWTRGGQWQFGKPTGQGGTAYGNHDPTGGHTGQNVFGVNLSGDYDTTVGGPYSLLAGPFDLRGYENVHLRLWSWLNTDWAQYVRNSLEVSLDGKTWLLVSDNPDREPVADGAWSRWECGIGPWVDGQPTVYLRWSYQVVKERACAYSGWNLDDIQLCGTRR